MFILCAITFAEDSKYVFDYDIFPVGLFVICYMLFFFGAYFKFKKMLYHQFIAFSRLWTQFQFCATYINSPDTDFLVPIAFKNISYQIPNHRLLEIILYYIRPSEAEVTSDLIKANQIAECAIY